MVMTAGDGADNLVTTHLASSVMGARGGAFSSQSPLMNDCGKAVSVKAEPCAETAQ
jgi:hypothetical protein